MISHKAHELNKNENVKRFLFPNTESGFCSVSNEKPLEFLPGS